MLFIWADTIISYKLYFPDFLIFQSYMQYDLKYKSLPVPIQPEHIQKSFIFIIIWLRIHQAPGIRNGL